MPSTTVTVNINHEGNPTIDVDHHQGPSCKKLVEPFKRALGNVVDETVKPEYHRPEANRNLRVTDVRNR